MSSTTAPAVFTPETEARIRESLKRCRPEVIEAAVDYRKNNAVEKIPTVVLGIIERFIEPSLQPKLHQEDVDAINLIDDLGVDSLVMVEIVVTIEENLKISIPDTDLQTLRTVGDIKGYFNTKLSTLTTAG